MRERRRAMDFVLLFLVMLLRQEVAALRLLHINVPAYTLRGRSALLECRYDLERDHLYGITWYKDNEVFYKYVLREKIPHIYDVNGVKVDRGHSNDQIVTLQDASLLASGTYRCEVNAEAPSFTTAFAEARMEVIALPQEKPKIIGEEKVYASGDVLALNCTSDKSHPPAKLKWFVNGQQVKPDSELVFEQHGLYSTISSLLLELEPGHLASDKINVRCEATVRSTHEVSEPFVDVRNTEVFVIEVKIGQEQNSNEKLSALRMHSSEYKNKDAVCEVVHLVTKFRGLASVMTPSLCLLVAVVLQQFLLPV